MRSHRFQVLVVARADRLTRREPCEADLLELVESGGRCHSVRQQWKYSRPPCRGYSKEYTRLLDQEYSLKLGEWIAAGKLQKFESEQFTNGNPVLGTKHAIYSS